jgi:hypothetical protein
VSDTIVNVITGKLLGLAKGATAAVYATVATVDSNINALHVAIVGTPALPADAATATLQGTGNASAATTATQTTTTATNTGTLAGVVNSGAAITKQKAGTAYNSAALEKSAVVSASACSPAMARMWNAGGSTRFLQGHDANALPANGAIPDDVVSVGTAAAAVPIVWPIPSNGYANGFVAACSTTAATLTITGTNDALFSIILFPSGS